MQTAMLGMHRLSRWTVQRRILLGHTNAAASDRYSAKRKPATVGSTISEPPCWSASGIMAWATSASTAPPASASQKIATNDSELEMNALPSAAARTPATSTLDQSAKI